MARKIRQDESTRENHGTISSIPTKIYFSLIFTRNFIKDTFARISSSFRAQNHIRLVPFTPRLGSKTRPITKRYRATRNINIYACITPYSPPLIRFFPNFYLSADFSGLRDHVSRSNVAAGVREQRKYGTKNRGGNTSGAELEDKQKGKVGENREIELDWK